MKSFIKVMIFTIVISSTLSGTALAKNPSSSHAKTSILPVSLNSEVSFDHCHILSFYVQEAWYNSFIDAIDKANPPITRDITEGCYSKNGNMFVFIVPGDYCQSANIYRFKTDEKVLEKATLIDHERGCLASPQEFGPRVGNIIKLKGFGGDAGCSSTQYFDYKFLDNTVELKKEYSKCEGSSGEWEYYG